MARDVDEVLSEYEAMYAKGEDEVMKKMNDEVDKAFRAAAKDMYQEDGVIEIDNDAVVSLSDDYGMGITGAYVAAWVYVPRK